MEDSQAIVSEVTEGVGLVRLNRPNQRNALSIQNLRELEATLSSLLCRTDVKALIVTGSNNVFAAGADLRELLNLDSASALEFARMGQRVFQQIADAQQTTIAAINGYCIGGGLDFALACDIRLASKSAVFSHPGAARGIITGWGGTQRLPRIIGRTRAVEFFATAGRYSSLEALRMGLVSYVGDPVLEYALKLVTNKKEGGGVSATFEIS